MKKWIFSFVLVVQCCYASDLSKTKNDILLNAVQNNDYELLNQLA